MKKHLAVLLALVFAFSLFAPLSAVASTAAASTNGDACCDGRGETHSGYTPMDCPAETCILKPWVYSNQYSSYSSTMHRKNYIRTAGCFVCPKITTQLVSSTLESHGSSGYTDNGHGLGNIHHYTEYCRICFGTIKKDTFVCRDYPICSLFPASSPVLVES